MFTIHWLALADNHGSAANVSLVACRKRTKEQLSGKALQNLRLQFGECADHGRCSNMMVDPQSLKPRFSSLAAITGPALERVQVMARRHETACVRRDRPGRRRDHVCRAAPLRSADQRMR